jgi:hypothetical protein
LNEPGSPNAAFLNQTLVLAAVVPDRKMLHRQNGTEYHAFVDMSGCSSDDACLAIAHAEGDMLVLDLVEKQAGEPPFNPRHAVKKFAKILHEFGLASVTGDNYAGTTFAHDFEELDISYHPSRLDTSEIYERFEPKLNAGDLQLLDSQTLIEQLLTLVVKGAKIGHEPGAHGDWANAAFGALGLAAGGGVRVRWFAASVDGSVYGDGPGGICGTPSPLPYMRPRLNWAHSRQHPISTLV